METNKSSPKTTLYPRLPHHIHYLPNLQFRFTLTSCFMFVFQSWFYSHNCSRSFYSPLERGRIHFFLNIQSNNTRHSWFSSMRQNAYGRIWNANIIIAAMKLEWCFCWKPTEIYSNIFGFLAGRNKRIFEAMATLTKGGEEPCQLWRWWLWRWWDMRH